MTCGCPTGYSHSLLTQREKTKYVDVTSLYPWVNKECEYPVGHPQVIVNPEDQDIHHYIHHTPFYLFDMGVNSPSHSAARAWNTK